MAYPPRATLFRGAIMAGLALSAAACSKQGLPAEDPVEAGTDAPSDHQMSGVDGQLPDVIVGGDPTAVSCATLGAVTFRMLVPAGFYYLRSFDNPGDGYWWYSVAKSDGTPLQIFLKRWTTCSACVSPPVPVGFGCSQVPADGATAIWNGTAMTGASSCTTAGGLSVACDVAACLPAGRYVVTMCAGPPEEGCDPWNPSHCVDVPFDYPTDAEVVGTLPPG